MAKKHKKRNKRYSGEDAKLTGVAGLEKPVVHRFEAKQRNPVSQWLFERKKIIRLSTITVGIITFIVIVIIGLVQSF